MDVTNTYNLTRKFIKNFGLEYIDVRNNVLCKPTSGPTNCN